MFLKADIATLDPPLIDSLPPNALVPNKSIITITHDYDFHSVVVMTSASMKVSHAMSH